MTELDRRNFLRSGAAIAAGATLFGGPLNGFVAYAAESPPRRRGRELGYGPLCPVADLRDGVVRLHLPEGFEYRSFTPAGEVMSDGVPTPGRHDGMAAFRGRGRSTLLVRNHEINGPVGAIGDRSTAYDGAAGGGTTTVEVDAYGHVQSSRVSLNGTQMNCSGGLTPWDSWLTCEETVNGPDVGNDFTGQDNSLLQQPHGYVFEVPAHGTASGEPVRNAGRFAHEAAVYDRDSGAVYLTEDNFAFPSGFYRYLPPTDPQEVERLQDGGRLQMLAVAGWSNADLAGVDGPAPALGSTYAVQWVDIDDPDPTFTGTPSNDTAIQAVGLQGLSQGAARFSRLEGAVAERGTIYFCSTQGGDTPPGEEPPSGGYGSGRGQIWAYHAPSNQLRLVYESPSRSILDLPDNITTSRRGTLVLCEDGDEGNFLRGLTPEGEIFSFAKNAIEGRTDDEFAGATFSPDRRTLYVNIQASNGLTFAIWGRWGGGGF
jgi:secreted PhoX family phosphatase